MKLTQYLHQAWYEAKAKPLYTILYITGVTLAIALTMIFANYYIIRIAPIYPEVNRNKTYYITTCTMINSGEGYSNSWFMGTKLAKEVSDNIKSAENLSIIGSRERLYAKSSENPEIVEKFAVRSNDEKFFKVFEFEFLAGTPFSREELESNQKVAVITDATAKKLFTAEYKDIIGKTIQINSIDYMITGIVRHCSQLCTEAYADIYKALDYSSVSEMQGGILGGLNAVMTIKDDTQYENVKKECDRICDKISEQETGWTLQLGDQPKSHLRMVLQDRMEDDSDFSWWNVIRNNMIVVIVLLLVPALNMSGMISGRMDARQQEIGIRKSFGATKATLLSQIFTENMFYTLIGAVLGLVISWTSIIFGIKQLILMFDPYSIYDIGLDTDIQVSFNMIFSPEVFFTALIVIFIFNSLSALIPAWWAINHNIVNSLNNTK